MKGPPDILEDWLQDRIPGNGGTLLDIGAYHGDFTEAILQRGVCQKAHLFEPHPVNCLHLGGKFAGRTDVTVHRLALGADTGPADLFSTSETATASTLPYISAPGEILPHRVEKSTLDDWACLNHPGPISVIKIDTQGADLDVLRGAERLIASHRPWIIVEMIFLPLYAGQAAPHAVLSWAGVRGYRIGSWFNEHWNSNGDLAFADVVLAPSPTAIGTDTAFVARPSTLSLETQIKTLEQACAERLTLINYLHTEAEKRLVLIDQLTRAKP